MEEPGQLVERGQSLTCIPPTSPCPSPTHCSSPRRGGELPAGTEKQARLTDPEPSSAMARPQPPRGPGGAPQWALDSKVGAALMGASL